MMDSFNENNVLDINSINENKTEEVFFFQSKHDTDLNVSISEDNYYQFQASSNIKNTKTISNNNNTSANSSIIELKRKKNREASRISRKKKNDDIVNLIRANTLLKAKIKALTDQLNNKICLHCKMIITHTTSQTIINETEEMKPKHIVTSSPYSALFNTLPNRAKTAMFISMVVIFCVIVNSFGEKGKNSLRKVSMKNYINDYFDSIEFADYSNEMSITKCFDFMNYFNNINRINEYAKGIIIKQENQSKSTDCQQIYIDDIETDDYSYNKSIDPIQLKLSANKYYLINQIIKEDNTISQSDTNHSQYIQLTCIDIHINEKKP